jgi:hypothetical protein
MRFPVFRQIVAMTSLTLPVAGTVTNYDPLIAEGYTGKTGSDSAAGGCLAFSPSGAGLVPGPRRHGPGPHSGRNLLTKSKPGYFAASFIPSAGLTPTPKPQSGGSLLTQL